MGKELPGEARKVLSQRYGIPPRERMSKQVPPYQNCKRQGDGRLPGAGYV